MQLVNIPSHTQPAWYRLRNLLVKIVVAQGFQESNKVLVVHDLQFQ